MHKIGLIIATVAFMGAMGVVAWAQSAGTTTRSNAEKRAAEKAAQQKRPAAPQRPVSSQSTFESIYSGGRGS